MSQRSVSIVSLCGVAVLSMTWLALTPSRADDEKADLNQQITALLEQRRDTLKERFEVLTALRKQGISNFHDVIQASEDLAHAKLELASGKDERITISKERVENLRRGEEIVTALVARSAASHGDKLKATAARQQAEIDLLREQLRSQ